MLVSFGLDVTLPVCASSVVVKGVVGGSVVLRPWGKTVVCAILAVEEWVEEIIVEKAAVEGIKVVVIRTVVVLGVVIICSVVEIIVVDGGLVVLVV
jgi:hypothetical protein